MDEVLVSATDIASRVDAMAQDLGSLIDADTVVVAIMSGACLFAADMLRALYRCGLDPVFDTLQLDSYHDARASSGRVQVRCDVMRSVAGQRVIVLDDVLDSGTTLAFAVQHLRAKGARDVRTVVMVRKPWPIPRAVVPDLVGFDVPARFLVGYGMDDAGRMRGCPDIRAAVEPEHTET